MMKFKLICCIVIVTFLATSKIDAQRKAMDNPIVEVNENKFFRYGMGTSIWLTQNAGYVSLDFEVGYTYRINSYFSTSAHLNYGFSLEEGIYFQALQSHGSLSLLFSPAKQNKEYIFKLGGGGSVLAAHEIYQWNNQTTSGVFPGFCVVMENEIFNEKKNSYLVINLFFGHYKNRDTLLGLSLLRGVSVSKIKENRKRIKNFLTIP